MKRDLIQQLKSVKEAQDLRPRGSWVAENKKALFASLEQKTQSQAVLAKEKHIEQSYQALLDLLMPFHMRGVVQRVFTVMVALGLTVGGWGVSVSASSESLPGDLLYSVKLAAEKTQIAVASATGNNEAETKLHLKSAEKRAQELKRVTQPKQAEKVLKELRKSTESAEKNLQEVKKENVTKAQTLAKNVTESTDSISKTLKEVSMQVAVAEDIKKEVTEVRKDVSETALNAITSLSPDEAKMAVEKKIEEILIETQEARQVVQSVSSTVGNIELKEVPVVPSSTPVIVTSTEQVSASTSLNGIPAEGQAVVPVSTLTKQAGESIQKAQEVATEAKELLATDQVSEAILKMKTLQEITSQTQGVMIQLTEKKIELLKQQTTEPTTQTGEQKTTEPTQTSTPLTGTASGTTNILN